MWIAVTFGNGNADRYKYSDGNTNVYAASNVSGDYHSVHQPGCCGRVGRLY